MAKRVSIAAGRAANTRVNGMATIVMADTIGTTKSWRIGKLRIRIEERVGK